MNLKTKLQTQGHGFKTHDLLTQRDLSNLKYLHYSLQSHALSIYSLEGRHKCLVFKIIELAYNFAKLVYQIYGWSTSKLLIV